MSDNEYEAFEINDYDLENEFNPNRPRRNLSKNQQIYGIWAADSDDEAESDDGLSKRGRLRRGGGSKNTKNYSKPLSFVAGGIHQAGKKEKKKDDNVTDEEDEDESNDESDDENERPSFGRKQKRLMNFDSGSGNSSSSEEASAKYKSEVSMKPPKVYLPNSRNVGAWEQHTRGIGAKLLLQMGYEPGKGLGKDLQGISQPVQAHVRKGRGAIGAYGPEGSSAVPGSKIKPKEDEDVKEAKEFREKLNKWKKGDGSGTITPKQYYYTSVEEIIEKGKKIETKIGDKLRKTLANVPVIDMTGPEKRVLSGYHALGQTKILEEDVCEAESKKAAQKPGFELNELMHNLNLLIDLCEQEIVVNDKTENECCAKQHALEMDQAKLKEVSELEAAHIETLEKALNLVEELTDEYEKISLDRAEKIFLELQSSYTAEYKEFGLADLAAGAIAPLVKTELREWKLLEEPTKYIDLIKKWRGILGAYSPKHVESQNVFDPYSSLVWAGVLPSFRSCIASWNPKQHQQMAALLDSWAPLFPSWILDSVLEKLILPCLADAVESWDPLTDTVPIHSWILPWHAILGEKLKEKVYPKIREKLGSALQAWVPHDRSARAMLEPWKDAFDDKEMTLFLVQHIIPKLQLVLSEFIINPIQQDLESWYLVWDWHKLIPSSLMAQLLDQYFFPNFMQVLVLWLNQSPDFGEISRWYTGWKSMLSEEILKEHLVKEHLRRALDMMQRAADIVLSTNIPGIPPPPSISGPSSTGNQPRLPSRESTPPPPPPPSILDIHLMTPAQLEFKELILQKCSERGILFAPMPGRREMGKQIYRVGKLFCYIDRNVCMVSDGTFKSWLPTSIVQLLEIAQQE